MSEPKDPKKKSRFSRRGLLQGLGISSAAVGVTAQEARAQAAGRVMSGTQTITLTVNNRPMRAEVEPRETLLDTLRFKLDLTGAKRVCDRGTCGACTVIMNGRVVYACSVLAIDAVGKKIETVENLTAGGKTHPIVPAFVNHDAQQCGYCTPGFVMASKGLLDRNPNPSYEQVKDGLGGNLCRCGTYVGVRQAVLEAARNLKG